MPVQDGNCLEKARNCFLLYSSGKNWINILHLVEGSNSAIAKLAIAFLIHFLWICICEAMASDTDKFYWHWEDIRFLTHIKKETKYKWPKIGILISGKIKVTVDVR